MQRSTRFNRPTLRGSSVAALLFDKQDSFVLKAAPDSTTSTSLTWQEAVPKPSDYRIERSLDGTTFSTVTTVANSVVDYIDTGLTESTQYWYRIVPIIGGTDQTPSNIADTWTVPSTPTGLTATAISSTQIDLAWTDVSTGNTAQSIQRRSPAGSGSYSFIASVGATANSYSDTGLTAATQYEYQVAATNPATQSAWSTAANATTTGGGPTPSWSLDFSTGTPSGYTLTRASSGTYVDSSGYIASASTNVARLTHDSSGSRLGLLVEGQRANECKESNTLSTAPWQVVVVSRTANATTSPDGTNNAWRITEASLASPQFIYQQTANLSNVCISVYLKKDQRDLIGIRAYQATNNWLVYIFDLTNGTVGSANNGTSSSFTSTSAKIEDVGNGWYRCSVSASRSTSANTAIAVQIHTSTTPTLNSFGEQSYTGNTANGFYMFGAQVEGHNTPPTSYIPTTTASVTRSADLAHVLDSTITGWQDPGALVVHFYPPPQAGTVISTDDASAEQLGIEASSTTAVRAFWSNGQTATGTMTTGVQKAVHYWNGTASSFCLNGGTVQTGTNNIGTFGNIDFVTFGSEATVSGGAPSVFSQFANCVIRKIEFYSGTLTSGNLQTITT